MSDDKPSVYLAGPIDHAPDHGHGWRDVLSEHGDFEWLNPLDQYDSTDPEQEDFTPTEIVESDKELIDAADVVLVGWTDQLSSAGTPMEIMYSFDRDIPVVVWERDVRHDISPWIEYHAAFVGDGLEACLGAIRHPYGVIA